MSCQCPYCGAFLSFQFPSMNTQSQSGWPNYTGTQQQLQGQLIPPKKHRKVKRKSK